MPKDGEDVEGEETPKVEEGNTEKSEDKGKKSKKKSKDKEAPTKDAAVKDAAVEDVGEDKDEDKEGGEDLTSQEQLMQLLRQSRVCEASRKNKKASHQFWDTQPVPSIGAEYVLASESGPIDEIKTPADVKDEPYSMPSQFEWVSVNVDDDEEAQDVYSLLTENYVEDDDCMFRFDYSIPFLRWALKPPGFLRHWHLGVRVKGNAKLVGFISAIPATIVVCDQTVNMVEINFLCVHKKLRSKRLAPVLIKEITRRVNKENIWQAVYTAGVVLPRPVNESRYYHRSLNPKKLIEVGFSHLGPRMTMARTIKLYKVSDVPALEGMRQMEPKDINQVHELVTRYLKKFQLHPEFEVEELAHWILPREDVVYSYVRESSEGNVTDVCSFYNLPSSILGNDKYSRLKAAYSFWNVATTVPLTELMADALVFARQQDFDVFNALNVMDNESFLSDLKFGIGDGFLQYYLYNWKCPKMDPSGIGLVLL